MAKFTPKHDKSPHLTSGQKGLPDVVQRAVIAKKKAQGGKQKLASFDMGVIAHAFNEELEKISGLDVSDLEDDLGFYLSDASEVQARRRIKEQKQKRFALRHPWLTGIPTLGIAPTVSKYMAIDEIKRQMLRGDEKLRKRHAEATRERRNRALQEYRMETERLRARAPVDAVSEAGKGAVMYALAKQYGRE